MQNAPSIKKNFAYKSALTLSTYVMSFITFPYVSRVLGVERLGLVNFVDNTVNYFLLFATLGVGLLGVREIAGAKNDVERQSKIFSNILGMNLLFTIFTLAVYVAAIFLVPRFHQSSELFFIGTAKILFTAFLVEWFFTGIENFKYITIRSLLVKLLYVLAVFLFVKTSDDYKLYFILTVGVVVVNATINMVYVRRFVSISFADLFRVRYIKQNMILGIYTIMTSMYITFNVMFLGLVSNDTEVGYYTTAFKLYSVILGFFTAFTNVMLPRMSSLLANGEKDRFNDLIAKSFSAMFTFIIPLVLCSMVMAPQIIYVLSGPGYEGAILPMRIIMPAAIFVGIAQVLAVQVIMPMKHDKVLLLASLIGATVSLIINICVVSQLQSVGSAIVLLSAEMVVTVTYIIYYALKVRIFNFPISKIVHSILLSSPCCIICFLCASYIERPYVSLLCSIILSCFVLCFFYRKDILKILNKIKFNNE